MSKTQSPKNASSMDLHLTPENEIIRFPPLSQDDFHRQLKIIVDRKESVKSAIAEAPPKFLVFSTLVSAYNVLLRKESQMLTYAKAADWL